ncbi:MAG: glycosyltransferase family 4 protein [Verrucomicrobiota bacterium]
MLKPIIFLQGTSSFGGSKRSLLTLTEILPQAGFQPIIACGEQGWLTDELKARDVPFFFVPFYGWRKILQRPLLHFSISGQWLAKMQEFNPCLIHSNEFWWAPHASLIAKILKIPSVVHLRTLTHDVVKARQYRLECGDGLVCISRDVKEKFSGATDLYDKSRIIFNGIGENNFSESEITSARGDLGLTPETIAVGNLGKLCENKNQRLLLRIAGKLARKKDLPAFHVFLAGEGDTDYLQILRGDIARLGLEKIVTLSGRVDSRPFLAAMDLIVHCSQSEGLSRVIPEAMLSRRAVITVDSGGLRDAIPDERFGRVVGVNDELALQNEMEQFFRDRNLRERTAQNAFERAAMVFSLDASRDALAGLYRELISRYKIKHVR